MTEKLGSICGEHIRVLEQMVPVDVFVKLRTVSFYSPANNSNPPVIFLGGLSTVVESFTSIIRDLTKDFNFHAVETRDHASSQLGENQKFDMETMGRDLGEVVKFLNLTNHQFILLGYSLGVAVIVEALRFMTNKPLKMIFLEPTTVFHYPSWSIPVIKLSLLFKTKRLRFIAKWYINNFVIDKKADAEMAEISSNAIDNADTQKLKRAILAIAGYEIWEKIEHIDCPVLIISASKDKMHRNDDILRLNSLITDCRIIDLETNKRSHSMEASQIIRNFILT